MKKQPYEFQLIDGTFTPDQARQVLGAMVQSKIDYHSLERHSESERSGITHSSEERLRALRALATELKDVFESAHASGAQLKVTGEIKITLME